MKKTLFALATCAFVATSFGVQAETLRVSTNPTFAPFEFKDSKTHAFTGFDLELIQAIGKQMGAKVEIASMEFDAIIPSLISGSTDIGASGFTITEKRKKHVLFSDPYYNSALSMLVLKKDGQKYKAFNDLKNKVICAQIGTSGSLRANKIPGAKVLNFNTQPDTILELSNHGCTAVIGDKPVLGYFLATNPKRAKAFAHIEVDEEVEQYGFAVNKNRPELQARINKALKELKANGEFAKLNKKWFAK